MSLRRRALLKQLPPPVQLVRDNYQIPFEFNPPPGPYIWVSEGKLYIENVRIDRKYYFHSTFTFESQDIFCALYWSNWQGGGYPGIGDSRYLKQYGITSPMYHDRPLGSVRFFGIPTDKYYKGTLTFICIDLTATYGAGNEPTTVEQVRLDYPNDYYPYNPGN